MKNQPVKKLLNNFIDKKMLTKCDCKNNQNTSIIDV